MDGTQTNQLIVYEQACRDIASITTPEAAIEFAAKSDAVRVYAKIAKNIGLEIDAAEIRIRAEFQLGKILIEGKKRGEFNRLGQKDKRRLIDMGIDKKLSMRSQNLARMGHSFHDELFKWRARVSAGDHRVIPNLMARGPKKSNVKPRNFPEPSLNFRVAGRGLWANIGVGELHAILEDSNRNLNIAMAVLKSLPQGLSTSLTIIELIDDGVLDVNVIKSASNMCGDARP